MTKKRQVIVIGAGASGLIAAITARENGMDVLIVERMPKPGKKILATGNGKCNISNEYMNQQCFRTSNEEFLSKVLPSFTVEDTKVFFNRLGLLLKDKDGYLYPVSEQATAVLQALLYKIRSLNISIDMDTEVISIKKKGQTFLLQTKGKTYEADHVILSTGGKAYDKLGSNGSGYELAKSFGHSIIPVVPALTGLKTSLRCFKEWAGVRAKGKLSVFINGKFLVEEQGEIQFANYGISGVPTFQVSRFVTNALYTGKKVDIKLDLMPEFTIEELKSKLTSTIVMCSYKNVGELLEGFLPSKLIPYLIKTAGLSEENKVNQLKDQHITKLTDTIKGFMIPINGCNDFDQAQVCSGGVDTREINPETMESLKVKGLYLTGELLDVDGTCGGYNLQWAWTTGFIAGNSIRSI